MYVLFNWFPKIFFTKHQSRSFYYILLSEQVPQFGSITSRILKTSFHSQVPTHFIYTVRLVQQVMIIHACNKVIKQMRIYKEQKLVLEPSLCSRHTEKIPAFSGLSQSILPKAPSKTELIFNITAATKNGIEFFQM